MDFFIREIIVVCEGMKSKEMHHADKTTKKWNKKKPQNCFFLNKQMLRFLWNWFEFHALFVLGRSSIIGPLFFLENAWKE